MEGDDVTGFPYKRMVPRQRADEAGPADAPCRAELPPEDDVAAIAATKDHVQEDPRGGWVLTYPTGVRWFPFDPRPEEVFIADIAHHLSLLCRFGGAVRTLYSVAEHSVRASLEVVSPDRLAAAKTAGRATYRTIVALQLKTLMHDAAEAYPPYDIVRPVKRHPDFAPLVALQARADVVICQKWHLLLDEPLATKAVDNRMLATESRDLRAKLPEGDVLLREDAPKPYPERIQPWPAPQAEQRFLRRFHWLMDERAKFSEPDV